MIFDILKNLFKKFTSNKKNLRPPGASKDFLAKCIRCGQCVQVCQYRSIFFGGPENLSGTGTPYIDPARIPCYLSMECVKVCPTGALQKVDKKSVRMAIVSIEPQLCFAYKKVICKFCFKNCPLQGEAIIMNRIEPVIVKDKCTGCGVCYHVCPAKPNAIKINPIL
ncbi:MAG: 4Fe-4S dicluster domain-containing protein [Desulfobacterales bacterium]|nr:4Fe-4S dicluster domain-containing protein [Desulfobacterales bacterium]